MTQPAAGSAAPAAGAALPVVVDTLANRVIGIYTRAEQDLLDQLAAVARHGLTDRTAAAQAAMLARMIDVARRIQTRMRLQIGPLTQQLTTIAARHGDAAAVRALQAAVAGHPSLAPLYLPRIAGASGQGLAAANAIAVDLASRLDDVTRRITRYADDAYRAAVADAASRLVLGREGLTPATAQGRAWAELTRHGVTGYTDRAGHRWNLSSYVEVATRTATQRAYNAAHEARMTAVGVEFFTVARDGHPCPLCLPWEGAVMAAQPGIPDPAVRVKATVEEARAAGLFHPNCRHVLVPYFPGVTHVAPPSAWTAADDARYRATQRLRALERQVRMWKRQQASALDDLARQRAARRVRVAQAAIRAHVAQNDLVRRTRREQTDLGLAPR